MNSDAAMAAIVVLATLIERQNAFPDTWWANEAQR
ncbi:hypothetical protein LCGC14_2506690, partial [marine sediment metagenome]